MKIRTLGMIVAVLVALVVVWGIWRLTHQWAYDRVGPYEVRRNTVTGMAQIRGADGEWTASFTRDVYAPGVTADDLKQIRLKNGSWAHDGILCGEAENLSKARDVKGRLAFLINIYGTDGKRLQDRTLRVTVDWPAGTTQRFILRTGLSEPKAHQRWTVDLVTAFDSAGT